MRRLISHPGFRIQHSGLRLFFNFSITSTAADRFMAVKKQIGVCKEQRCTAASPAPLSFAPACDVVSPTRRTQTRASWWSRGRTGASEPRPFVGPGCASYRWLWKNTKGTKHKVTRGHSRRLSQSRMFFFFGSSFLNLTISFPQRCLVIQYELSKGSLLLTTDESWFGFSINHFQ